MDGVRIQSIVFGCLIVIVYAIHQVTVGGDGVVFAAVVSALGVVGGYAIGFIRHGGDGLGKKEG